MLELLVTKVRMVFRVTGYPINPHFTHAGRIGLPLAYALFTALLHMYNCRKTSKDTLLDTVSTQLGFYTSETPVKFGITPKNCDDANHCLIDDETAVHGDITFLPFLMYALNAYYRMPCYQQILYAT